MAETRRMALRNKDQKEKSLRHDFKLDAPWGVVWIYRHDHTPAHAHAFYEREEVIVRLDTLTLRRRQPNLNDDEIEKVLTFVREHQTLLLSEWTRLHG